MLSINTTGLDERCFSAQLVIEVQAAARRAGTPFTVAFTHSAPGWQVSGLPNETVSTGPQGKFQVPASVTVCAPAPAPPVRILPLRIEARANGQRYFAFPALLSESGSERADATAAAEALAYGDQIDQGGRDPGLLRAYWRAIAAHGAGGLSEFVLQTDAALAAEAAGFDRRPTPAAWAAYRDLLLENGGEAGVSWDALRGEPVLITLNAAYQLGETDYVADAQALLRSNPLASLLSLTDADSFVVRKDDETPGGRIVLLDRRHGGDRVFNNTLILSLRRLREARPGWEEASGWFVESIASSLGRITDESCDGANDGIRDKFDLLGKTGFRRVHFMQGLLRLDSFRYRCVFEWHASYFDPELGGGEAGDRPYIRRVDAVTGEFLLDSRVPMDSGADMDDHYVETRLTIPFESTVTDDGQMTIPTRVPYTTVRATLPGEDVHEETTSFDAAFSPFALSIALNAPHDVLLYAPILGTNAAGFEFETRGDYDEYWTNWHSARDFDHWGFDAAGNTAIDYESANPLTPWNGNVDTIGLARSNQMYFWAQYARYIWGFHPTDRPWTYFHSGHDGDDLDIVFRSYTSRLGRGAYSGPSLTRLLSRA